MKYCSECGTKLLENSKVCPKCGNKVNNNGFAIAGFVLSFFSSVLGLVFGIIGLNNSKKVNGEGKELSIAAIVIASINIFIALIILFVVFPLFFSFILSILESAQSF